MRRAGKPTARELRRSRLEAALGQTVRRLDADRSDADTVMVKTEAGAIARIAIDDVSPLGLSRGAVIDRASQDAIRHADDRHEARRAAMRLLTTRPRTRGDLERRLAAKRIPEGAAREALDRLEGVGLIDDRAAAASGVRSTLARKPAGARLLRAKLAQQRVPADVAGEAVEEALGSRDIRADALAVARSALRRQSPRLETAVRARRVFAAVARRGFDADVCREATQRAIGQTLDAEEEQI